MDDIFKAAETSNNQRQHVAHSLLAYIKDRQKEFASSVRGQQVRKAAKAASREALCKTLWTSIPERSVKVIWHFKSYPRSIKCLPHYFCDKSHVNPISGSIIKFFAVLLIYRSPASKLSVVI